MCLVRRAGRRRIDYASVTNENIPDGIATVLRIDHASACETGQHGLAAGNAARILPITIATDIAVLGFLALTAESDAVDARCSTASWSMPGRPTAMVTSAPDVSGLAVSATSSGLRFQIGDRAP